LGDLGDWKIGGLEDWRTGGLEDWRTGGMNPKGSNMNSENDCD